MTIIKPQYSSEDIRQIYYGKDTTKRADYNNPAYRRLVLMTLVLSILFLIVTNLYINTNWFINHDVSMRLKCVQIYNSMVNYATSNIQYHGLQWIFCTFGCLIIIMLYCFSTSYPIILFLLGIFGCRAVMKRALIKDGELYKSPISKKDYRNIYLFMKILK